MTNKSASQIEREIMFHFGTDKWSPGARVLLQTAQNDLIVARENTRIKRDKLTAQNSGANPAHQGKARKTGFLPQHIRYATNAFDVLTAALKGLQDGQKSTQVETRYLYKEEALREAIELARVTNEDVPKGRS